MPVVPEITQTGTETVGICDNSKTLKLIKASEGFKRLWDLFVKRVEVVNLAI